MNDIRKYINVIEEASNQTLPTHELIKNESLENLVDILVEMGPDRVNQINEELESLEEFRDDRDSQAKWQSAVKLASKYFGAGLGEKVKGAYRAFKNAKAFNKEWNAYSTEYNLQPTPENIKRFLRDRFAMGQESWDLATQRVKPEIDSKTGNITNLLDMVPALAFEYRERLEDKVDSAEDQDDRGAKSEPTSAEQTSAEPKQSSSKDLTADEITERMGNILKQNGLTPKQINVAIDATRKGVAGAMAKKDLLALIGYAYIKAAQ